MQPDPETDREPHPEPGREYKKECHLPITCKHCPRTRRYGKIPSRGREPGREPSRECDPELHPEPHPEPDPEPEAEPEPEPGH